MAAATQEHINQQVVDKTFQQIIAYQQQQAVSEWSQHYETERDHIMGLYEEFTPHLSMDLRMIGAILGATGMAWVNVRYGVDEHAPKLYSGSYEDHVLAMYHHGKHSRGFIRNEFRYAQAINNLGKPVYGEEFYVRAPGIAAFHDAILGNGRGNDELQSKLLATTLAQGVGFWLGHDEALGAGIDATIWDDALKAQSVRPTDSHLLYRRAAGVSDLMPLHEKNGVYNGLCLFVEDGTKKFTGQFFTKEAQRHGFDLRKTNIDACMAFVDESTLLTDALRTYVAKQPAFYTNFKAADKRLDELFPGGRQNNIDAWQRLANDKPSAVEILERAREMAA